jgi:hypothetical protein
MTKSSAKSITSLPETLNLNDPSRLERAGTDRSLGNSRNTRPGSNVQVLPKARPPNLRPAQAKNVLKRADPLPPPRDYIAYQVQPSVTPVGQQQIRKKPVPTGRTAFNAEASDPASNLNGYQRLGPPYPVSPGSSSENLLEQEEQVKLLQDPLIDNNPAEVAGNTSTEIFVPRLDSISELPKQEEPQDPMDGGTSRSSPEETLPL